MSPRCSTRAATNGNACWICAATVVSGLAMGAFAIAGAVVQLARGEDPNPYAWVCFVGGVSYAIGLAAFKLRG